MNTENTFDFLWDLWVAYIMEQLNKSKTNQIFDTRIFERGE